YNFAKSVNLSWCRSPDGIAELVFPCWPTPGRGNAAYPLATPNAPDPVQPPQPPAQPPAPKQQPPILSPGWELPNGVIGYL
ncbi:MAG: hypothetical protein U9Q82_04845, partial [Chloroflexota bacterium]|nr:hypothetical protein [Chloroflexota bacterium]